MLMPLRLYNTFSKQEEPLDTLATPSQATRGDIKSRIITMYTCGPTVYGRPHIGNYSSFLMADLLRRWLEVSGYQVKHVKNITDVGHLLHDADHGDDKIQKEAEKEKLHPLEIAQRYTEQYLEDERALNMLEPMSRPRASAFIKEQLKIIKILLEKGNVYETEDGVYFAVETFPQYGALSGNTLQNLSAGVRIAVDEKKKHPADFALWKKCVGDNGRHVLRWKFSTGEISQSEGEDVASGFPGWHIECSAMSSSLLGDQIDIHTGGEDNIFPHHECEIAQSEAATGKQFVRLWLHKRRIEIGDLELRDPSTRPSLPSAASRSMSKSLGNILTVPDIIAKGYSPLDLRYYLLSVHYRTHLKFTWKGMDDSRKARRKILDWISEVQRDAGDEDGHPGFMPVKTLEIFRNVMNEDLNTPAALAEIFGLMNFYYANRPFDPEAIHGYKKFIEVICRTFGCFESEVESVPTEVQSLLKGRDAARARKDFKESDRLRSVIKERGFEVKDTSQGQVVRKI